MIWMHEGLFCSLVFVFVFDSESLAGFLSPSASLPASQPRLCTGKGRREGGGRGLGAPNLKALGFQGKRNNQSGGGVGVSVHFFL